MTRLVAALAALTAAAWALAAHLASDESATDIAHHCRTNHAEKGRP